MLRSHSKQALLADALVEARALREKHRLDSRLMQVTERKAALMQTRADLGMRQLEEERSCLERTLQADLASKQCQVNDLAHCSLAWHS